ASVVDEIVPIGTDEAKAMTRRLAREEGVFAGTSSGANVLAAIQVGERLGPGATVVTVMPDTGLKYMGTDVFARAWRSRPTRFGSCAGAPWPPQLDDSGLHQALHQRGRRRFGQRESDGPGRGVVPLQRRGVRPPDGRGDGIQAAVLRPGRVPHERPAV